MSIPLRPDDSGNRVPPSSNRARGNAPKLIPVKGTPYYKSLKPDTISRSAQADAFSSRIGKYPKK